MPVRCNECSRWQGTKYSEWADCNWIISDLIPDWDSLRTRFGFPCRIPFDAHDAKYVVGPLGKPCDMGKGVKIQKRKEKDIWFDDDGNERTKTVTLVFYRTHKDYYCGYEEV